jgi:ubiquinone/menaquinone biosynthesis C-methylase UbiE
MNPEIEFEKYRKRGAYHWQQYFGSVFKIDSFLRARYDMVINLLRQSGASSSSSLLEVGCGDGALSGLIYKTFSCNIMGIEPSAEGIKFSREMFNKYNLKGKFEISEGYSYNFPDNHFDLIVLADVIEHLQHPDLMLKEIQRLLKVGGKAIITTPIRTSEKPEDVMHVQEFYPEELSKLCGQYFPKVLQKTYSHPVAWYELYTFGKKRNRSLIRLYCRVMDKIFGRNVFLSTNSGNRWTNFKQQALLLEKTA